MATIAEMGEVDEIHSNEDSIKDGASVNGESCDYKEDVENGPTENASDTNENEQENNTTTTIETDPEEHEEEKTEDEVEIQQKTDNVDKEIENGEDDEEEQKDGECEEEQKDEENEEEKEQKDEENEEEEKQKNQENEEEEVEEQKNEDDEDQKTEEDEVTTIDDDEPEKMDVDEEEIHEINSDDDDDVRSSNTDKPDSDLANGIDSSDDLIIESQEMKEPEKNKNSKTKSDDPDIVINDSCEGDDVVVLDDCKDSVENESASVNNDEGNDKKTSTSNDAEVIGIDDTSPSKKKKKIVESTGPPRRSSRNLNKERKSYVEAEEVEVKQKKKEVVESSEESDIEEVLPQDPLAVSEPPPVSSEKPVVKKARMSSSTIVVKDTKCLAEIASKSSANNNNKKEPTLVIIDTNSILSGRGPVPISQKSTLQSTISSSYSMLPMALPAQGVYPANMRATITPIPMSTSTPKSTPAPPPPPPVLPTLTDDMFVVEAPSFIVPYVYEKPPMKDLKEFVKNLETEIAEQKKKDEKAKQDKEGKKKDKSEDDDDDNDSDEEKMDADEEGETKKDDNEKENKDGLDITLVSGSADGDKKQPQTYFDSPLGKFFMGIGFNLVQEMVQTDLLKQQKRKRDRENAQNPETLRTINSLIKNLEYTKENNEPYHMVTKKCEFCSFKTESSLAMAFHLETPHMKNYVYRCNFCPYEVRSPHDILFHMEVLHGVRGRLERAPAFHQCPNCPFEDNQKGKLSRHLVTCARKFKPERNLEPPADFEPPAKIPRAPRMKQGLGSAAAVYQVMARNSSQYQMMSKMSAAANNLSAMQRGRGRPSLGTSTKSTGAVRTQNMFYKQASSMSGGSVLLPTNYQLSGNQLYQVVGGQDMSGRVGPIATTAFLPSISATPNTVTIQQQQNSSVNKSKPVQQPSISITPLPRAASTTSSGLTITKPGDSNSKNSFVICEICDGYIKDLEQLRNHMQWIHKVKIHPKMIYNRPPLNCQKCQFRFFTDQGLERHLLGSHGLVTSSMQEAANRSKDAGRCPVCGRVYQWKLLNHVARDHNMTLKPAHLSYKCTVCTATFGMYKQFESHVYSAHSVVAKRVMDKKNSSSSSSSSLIKNSESVLKPLKINDEITIIPQPAKPSNGSKDDTPSTSGTSISVRSSIGFSNGNPGTSKGSSNDGPPSSTSLSRSERLARRKTSSQADN